MIYLHETSNKKSSIGERVTDVFPTRVDEKSEYHTLNQNGEHEKYKKKQRVIFKFEKSPEGLDQPWQGQSHRRVWTGDIIDV